MRGCGRKLGPRKKVLRAWMTRPKSSVLEFDEAENSPQIHKSKSDAEFIKCSYETVVRVEIREVKR